MLISVQACDQFVHAICGSYSEDSGRFGLTVTCNLCVRKIESKLSEKAQNLVRNNKLKEWFLSPTQDF